MNESCIRMNESCRFHAAIVTAKCFLKELSYVKRGKWLVLFQYGSSSRPEQTKIRPFIHFKK
jgi:hypothetical protein